MNGLCKFCENVKFGGKPTKMLHGYQDYDQGIDVKFCSKKCMVNWGYQKYSGVFQTGLAVIDLLDNDAVKNILRGLGINLP